MSRRISKAPSDVEWLGEAESGHPVGRLRADLGQQGWERSQVQDYCSGTSSKAWLYWERGMKSRLEASSSGLGVSGWKMLGSTSACWTCSVCGTHREGGEAGCGKRSGAARPPSPRSLPGRQQLSVLPVMVRTTASLAEGGNRLQGNRTQSPGPQSVGILP